MLRAALSYYSHLAYEEMNPREDKEFALHDTTRKVKSLDSILS